MCREMERLEAEAAAPPHGIIPSMTTAAHVLSQIPQVTATVSMN
jgi:hypothetical protein